MSVVERASPWRPTAQTSVADTAVTPSSLLATAAVGMGGSDHLVPSKYMMSGWIGFAWTDPTAHACPVGTLAIASSDPPGTDGKIGSVRAHALGSAVGPEGVAERRVGNADA